MKYLIWADRIALVWWIFVAMVIYFTYPNPHASPFSEPGTWRAFEFFVGIPWLMLRGIDFIGTGQIRLGHRHIAKGSATADAIIARMQRQNDLHRALGPHY
jgi:hypothetical protein